MQRWLTKPPRHLTCSMQLKYSYLFYPNIGFSQMRFDKSITTKQILHLKFHALPLSNLSFDNYQPDHIF